MREDGEVTNSNYYIGSYFLNDNKNYNFIRITTQGVTSTKGSVDSVASRHVGRVIFGTNRLGIITITNTPLTDASTAVWYYRRIGTNN